MWAYSEVRSVVSQPKCNQIGLFAWIPDDGMAPATGIRGVEFEPTDANISPVSVRSALFKVAGYPGNFSRRAGTQRPPRRPMGQEPPVGRTPSHLPHRSFARVRAGAAEAARCRRRAPTAATPTAARWGHGGTVGAGAERHADEGDARLSSSEKVLGARGDRVGEGSESPAVAPLVRRPLAWCAWRRLRQGDCTGLQRWSLCGVGEKGVERRQRRCFGAARHWRRCGWHCV